MPDGASGEASFERLRRLERTAHRQYFGVHTSFESLGRSDSGSAPSAPLQFYLPPRVEDHAGEPAELVALKTHWRVIEKARAVWQIASSPAIQKNDI
jgi:hypothetical protein